MFNTFAITLAAASIAALITTIGIYVIKRYEEWGKRAIIYFISFAAGVLISVSFLHIIPESFEMNVNAPLFLLIGFLFLYAINRFLATYVCGKKHKTYCPLGIVATIGIGIHSFIDGIIYSVTFNVAIFTGALAAVGMILHEFPEGIVTFLLLIKSGFNKKQAGIGAFIAAAISTPLGAIISFPFISALDESMLGLMLAFSAGALLYLGASHLLPEAEKEPKKYSLLALAAGIAVAIIIVATGH